MLTDVDKEGSATVSFNDFVEMVTPKVLARDPKVKQANPHVFSHCKTVTRMIANNQPPVMKTLSRIIATVCAECAQSTAGPLVDVTGLRGCKMCVRYRTFPAFLFATGKKKARIWRQRRRRSCTNCTRKCVDIPFQLCNVAKILKRRRCMLSGTTACALR